MVLAQYESRKAGTVAAVCQQPFGTFVYPDGARSAAYGLKVVIRKAADCLNSREQSRAEPGAPGYVFYPTLGNVSREPCNASSNRNGVGVVRSCANCYDPH